jgi:cytoskeletal protein RodZ
MSDEEPPDSRRGLLIALVFLVVIGLLGAWISGALRSSNAVQDCVMQGRTNC